MSEERGSLDGVVANDARPRTRGARRRALPPEDIVRTAFAATTPTKRNRTHAKPITRPEASVFPSLLRASPTPSPWTLQDESCGRTRTKSDVALDRRHENADLPECLLQRLHASGIHRSHVQPNVVRSTHRDLKGNQSEERWTYRDVRGNQSEDSQLKPPRRPPVPTGFESKPLVPPLALHPSSDGVLVPTRPLTSSATQRVNRTGSQTSRESSLDRDGCSVDATRPTHKVPLTARDRFYLEQRATTAPSHAGDTFSRPRPVPPNAGGKTSRGVVVSARSVNRQALDEGKVDKDFYMPRRTDILVKESEFKTFTESIAEDLRRSFTTSENGRAKRGISTIGSTAPVAPDSFLYLRRVDSNPYHLVVTNHSMIDPENYYTASRLGITHFAHESSEFVPLEKFERENYIYSLLIKLPFFRKYRQWKRFMLWKQEINARKRATAALSLNQNLFVLLPHLHRALMQLRKLCVNMIRIELFDFNGSGVELTEVNVGTEQRTYTLGEFSIRLKAQKMECDRQVGSFIAEAAMIAKNACEEYLYAFLEETGFNEQNHLVLSNTRRQTNPSLALTPNDAKSTMKRRSATEALQLDQEMTYTERASMRTQCRKITKFLRVVDFLVSDALLRVAIASTENLVDQMKKIKDGLLPVSVAASSTLTASQAAVNAAILSRYKHTPLFRIEISMRGSGVVVAPPMLGSSTAQFGSRPRLARRQSSSSTLTIPTRRPSDMPHVRQDQSHAMLQYSPHEELMRSQLETLVFNGLKAVTTNDRLLSNSMFKIYIEAGMDNGLGGEDGDDDGGDNGELSGDGLDLDILIMEDGAFVSAMQRLNSIVQESFRQADVLCAGFSTFLRKFNLNVEFCERIIDPQYVHIVEVDELRDLLDAYTKEIASFDALADTFSCGLFLLDNAKINGQLKPSPRKCLELLHTVVPMVIQHKNAKLMDDWTNYNDKISAIPTTVDEYAETLTFLRELQGQVDTIEEQYSVLKSLYQLIEEFNIKIDDLDQTNAFLLSQRRAQLRTSMDLFESSCEQYTEKFGIELEGRIPSLVGQLTQVVGALSHEKLFRLDSDPQEVVDYLAGVEFQLRDLEETVERHYLLEKTLSLTQTSAFEELGDAKMDLELKTDLWNGQLMWSTLSSRWGVLKFPSEVDVPAITEEVLAFFDKILQWETRLSPGTGPLCAHLKAKVEDYRVTMPILHDLQCPSFEDRHYHELRELLGFSIHNSDASDRKALLAPTPSDSLPSSMQMSEKSRLLTLGDIVQMRLGSFAQQVNRIATDAIQERSLKETLEKVIAVWEHTEFDVRPYKESKEYSVIMSYDALYATLEESLVNLTALLNSKYLAPIRDPANTWQRRLALFQETLDAWLECQRKWMHLECIFAAPDIQKQLPNESMLFVTVNQFWKDLMRKARDQRNCMKVCGATLHSAGTVASILAGANNSAGISTLSPQSTNAHAGQISLLETLSRHNASLDKIEKSLEDYLETKRGFFPRFYFISNDELLEVLAHAKEPQSVQRHLSKCFDALVKLDLSEDSAHSVIAPGPGGSSAAPTASVPDILAMISPEGERVVFSRSLKARGNVEDWLNAVLSNMKVTLQRYMKMCILDYQHASREAWMFRHPAQCVAVVSYIMWARECESCFRSAADPSKELSAWHLTICSQLSNLTRLVRTSLTSVQRSLVVSLVTTDVHFRDVVEDLIKKKVTNTSDFVWVQQLRYYWLGDQDECVAKQANFKVRYGYEYMGACSRLVITPLTDRCWMTITGAFTLCFGAAPSGPAGTGKTETSKDLAKALGTLCIVFNCSDQIDYKMMAKIFNGAVQAGAWVCLDEFNRIDIEVLSVVAQQMATIRHARLRGATDVIFGGRSIPMREHHIIITMNPGYVGRTELPDNLKVCFRPVAMMVPDYALIAEILLFAEGFQQAKHLSKKMTKLYKLCSEQLSQQPHYDFGMRAVKSVLLMAGTLKRSQVGTSSEESLTLIQAIRDANMPKFLDDDALLFRGIVRDLFPEEVVTGSDGDRLLSDHGAWSTNGRHGQTSSNSFLDEIDNQIGQLGLSSTPKWKRKIMQLFETLQVRIGVVQVGDAGSGKSSAFKVLKETLTALREVRNHSDKRFQKVMSFVLNPKSITMNELYGFFHPLTREWTDGLASSILRQCISDKSEYVSAKSFTTSERSPGLEGGPYYWVTFDGPIDVLWIESMNTVLDDNMTLCLANGERIKLVPKIQLLFEVCDTASASPATVSRLGVVYYHPSYLGWEPFVEAWVNALSVPAHTTSSQGASSSPSKDGIHNFSPLLAAKATVRLGSRLKARIRQCFDLFLEPGLAFIRSRNRSAVPTSDICYISSLCSIFEALLLHRGLPETFAVLNTQLMATPGPTASAAAMITGNEIFQNRCIDLTFLFSFVWAFGGNLHVDQCKAEFQEYVFRLVEKNEDFLSRDLLSISGKIQTNLSHVSDNFFGFCVDFKNLSFVPWENIAFSQPTPQITQGTRVPPLEFDSSSPVFQLIVPTNDIIKYSYLTNMIALDSMLPTYLTGTTGSGKSVLVNHLLKARFNSQPSQYKVLPIPIDFSAQTSSLLTQITIESKLHKKRKTLLGAPTGTRAVIFIDDINMPSKEAYGAQPPIELLRQYLELGGVYDREKFFWKEFCDSVLVAAGGLPGGGRHALCPRFMRQFRAILCMPSSDEATIKLIFGSILSAHLAAICSNPSKSVRDVFCSLVDATTQLYRIVSQKLLPTPSKAYYTFNLRDITKVVQGIVLGVQSCGPEAISVEFLSRLWAHECIRVFRDRLIGETDRLWLSEQLILLTSRHLGLSWQLEHVYEPLDRSAQHRVVGGGSKNASSLLLFAPRTASRASDGKPIIHLYKQVCDIAEFEEHLDLTIQKSSKEKTSAPSPQLILFREAMVHVAAIARILMQPRGHALLLGIAGSGKRSLARVACFMMNYRCREIEVTKTYSLTDFREELRWAMSTCVLGDLEGGFNLGKQGHDLEAVKPVVLLLSENQLVSEQFVEDINTLLNGGEIPKLFPLDQYEKILSDVRGVLTLRQAMNSNASKHQDPDEFSRNYCEAFFRTQVQKAMHIVICHSPVGEVFRNRIRQFPSLVNCMTIDFFDAWPSHALQYVADRFLIGGQAGGDAPVDLPNATRQVVAVLCMEAHQAALSFSVEFQVRCKRQVHFTPKHFIDLICMFRRVYREKQAAVEEKLTRLSMGVIKLEETNALVATLQDELVALQPILHSKTLEAEHLLHQVGIDQRDAGIAAARVAQDEARVNQQQREVAACQVDAQNDLDQALPALNAAVHALDSLDKRDITEVKAFVKPPLAVQVVMEAVCIMLGERADWDSSKRMLSRPTFMSELKEYDKDNINPAILKRIRKYIENPDFAVDEVRKVSRAAMSLCMWVHAVDKYARVYKEVAPKRQRLAEMNGVLAEANAKLAAKQQELEQVLAKVQILKNQCDTTLGEKQRLVHESELTQARLQRAERLTVGLKDERVRWKEMIEQLRVNGKAVLGDSFLVAAALSYLGPFNGMYRSRILRTWFMFSAKLVEVSPSFSLIDSYGDAMELREWELLGLPSDSTSTENAIFVMKGNQNLWPLLIDPQQQATQWIHRVEAQNQLEVVKIQDRNLLEVVERALGEGNPILIEGITDLPLEQALGPVLRKAFVPVSEGNDKKMVKLGNRLVPVNASRFRLYLATQMPNPGFVPDVYIHTNVVNFTVTADGLSEQLLSDVVRRERVEVEERKHNLLYSITQDNKMLQQIEIKILSLLSESKGNILDDVELIQALETAKHTSHVVMLRLRESEVTKIQLLKVRSEYQTVATRGALLFFVVADLTTLDAMYQYSLAYFRRLFIVSLEAAPASNDIQERLENLKSHTMRVVYRNISRGLFEGHKLLFAALICFQTQFSEGTISPKDLQLLDASTVSGSGDNNSLGTDGDIVEALLGLVQASESFAHSLESYRSEPSAWTEWLTSPNPWSTKMPSDCDDLLTRFQRLVLIRWMRDDAWPLAMRQFVKEELGESLMIDRATEPTDSQSMDSVYADMDKLTPCLFILSSGADPVGLLTQFARELPGIYPDKYHMISLGQGQGPYAEHLLESCATQGHWLVMQNIHLAKSWIPRLEELLGALGKNERNLEVHDQFRLFLTAFPASYFPISILQSAVKVTSEPPRGIKANLQRSMALLEASDQECDRRDDGADSWISRLELQMVFALSFFHAVVQERAKFGSLGWNLTYDFSGSDFLSVVTLQRQLLVGLYDDQQAAARSRAISHLDYSEGNEEDGSDFEPSPHQVELDTLDVLDVPWDALHFLTGEIYYGGRVTDEFDRRCLMANLQRFSSAEAVATGAEIAATDGGFQCLFSAHDDSFSVPVFRHRAEMVEFVDALPPTLDAPFAFGMHPNANVFYQKQETQRLVAHIVQLQGSLLQEPTESALDDNGSDDDEKDVVAEMPQLPRRQSSQLGGRRKSSVRKSSVADAAASPEATALQACAEIQLKLPRPPTRERASDFSVAASGDSMPDPYAVVLQQELARCTALLEVVHANLDDVARAIRGLVAMSPQLEQVLQCLWLHHVPLEWRKRDGASAVTPTSTQSLALWVQHVRFRVDFLQHWETHGSAPNGIFPLSALSFPQGFFTAILQRHARKYVVPIHHLEFQFMVLREAFLTSRKHMLRRGYSTRTQSAAEFEAELAKAASDTSRRSSNQPVFDTMDGALISGLFLEGAQWSDEMQCLVDPKPGVMHHVLPVIHVIPQVATHDAPASLASPRAAAPTALTPSYLTLRSASAARKAGLDVDPPPAVPERPSQSPSPLVVTHKYVCPLYKTRARKGTLSTTGSSSNFVLAVELACERAPEHYALNGTAIISNLVM